MNLCLWFCKDFRLDTSRRRLCSAWSSEAQWQQDDWCCSEDLSQMDAMHLHVLLCQSKIYLLQISYLFITASYESSFINSCCRSKSIYCHISFYPMPQNITHLCLNKAIVRAAAGVECRAGPVNISTTCTSLQRRVLPHTVYDLSL